ncbi:Ferredoxin [Olavius sp. associated proteobacterium Delta 1]|nr:Ferredoxin [Olavius sp. associated proteobacterium Delta 1]
MDIKFFIVFSSPAGSTRRVAETIKKCMSQRNVDAVMLDLGKGDDDSEVIDSIRAAGKQACLFIGSPVYRDVAVPPIVSFIDRLMTMDKAMAVPFVTWGQACSGVALWQMGNALKQKGFSIMGAAKVLAVHSMMWQASTPAGQGHPDKSDLQKIEKLVQSLLRRFEFADFTPISSGTLDYQPHVQAEQMKKKIDAPWMIVPKSVNLEKCSQCGICEEVCPAAAVDIAPYPQINQNCFDCFNCIRLCPEDAIEPALSMNEIQEYIRKRVRTINEQPDTQIFCNPNSFTINN